MGGALATAALVVSGFVVAACASGQHVTVGEQPATVESVAGSSQVRIHLSALAARRLGIKTATIQLVPAPPPPTFPTTTHPAAAPATQAAPATSAPSASGSPDTEPHPAATPAATTPAPTTSLTSAPPALPRLVIPAGAVLYEPTGGAYTYTNPTPLTYVRQPLTVAYISGDSAVLTAGPPAGTVVVVVGGAELAGIETGVGQE
jgi:hypothetical protein